MVHAPRSNLVSEPCSMLVTIGSSMAAVMLSGTGSYVPSGDQKLSASPDIPCRLVCQRTGSVD
jgi:hypothetical protein